MSCCRPYCCPSDEILRGMIPVDRKYDVAKRIVTAAALLIGVLSIVLIGLGCNHMVHPAIGFSLCLLSCALGSVVGCLGSCHETSLQVRGSSQKDLYQMAEDEDD